MAAGEECCNVANAMIRLCKRYTERVGGLTGTPNSNGISDVSLNAY